MKSDSGEERAGEPKVLRVTLNLCELCLGGSGGFCNVPACALCRNRAPDLPITPELYDVVPPAQSPAEALGADEVAQKLIEKWMPNFQERLILDGGREYNRLGELQDAIASAIHAAEQRGRDAARREDAEIARLRFADTPTGGVWDVPYKNAGIMISSDILARLGGPERKQP